MKLTQTRIEALVIGAEIIISDRKGLSERVYLDELESWTLTLITKRSRCLRELHVTNTDDVSRKHIIVCFANETVPVMVAK